MVGEGFGADRAGIDVKLRAYGHVASIVSAFFLSSAMAIGQADVSQRWVAAGWQALNDGDATVAASAFTRAVVADPSNMMARRLLAQADLQAGKAQQALQIMQVVVKYDTGADSWACLGDADFALGNVDKAQASYQAAVRLQPLLAAANIGLVNVLVAKRQYPEAQQLCRTVLAKTRDKKLASVLSNKLLEIEQYGKTSAAPGS